MSYDSRKELFDKTGYIATEYFDMFNGAGLRNTKIATNADGSQVWIEPTQEGQVMASKADRDVLQAVAKKMGAKVSDPTGLYKSSIHYEARFASIPADAGSGSGFPEYEARRRNEMLENIRRTTEEELGKIG